MSRKLTRDEVIARFRAVHGDKYDYSLMDYKDMETRVCIICPIHGVFWQAPLSHLRGHGCSKCSGNRLMTTAEFIAKAMMVYGTRYTYEKTAYKNNRTKITVTCPIHGDFEVTPKNFLRKRGCPECAKESRRIKLSNTLDGFIAKAIERHGYKYDYSLVEYKGLKSLVCIICPIHGPFWQEANSHLQGHGCRKCANMRISEKKRDTRESFIAKAEAKHGKGRYDYSGVVYVDCMTPVKIICPIHGAFWQKPYQHVYGYGCRSCNESHLEQQARVWFEKHGVKYEQWKQFTWLGEQELDFYISEFNIGIECQGQQHYEPVDFAGKGKEWAEEEFNKTIERDQRKKQLCEENSLPLFYIRYDDKIEQRLKEILVEAEVCISDEKCLSLQPEQ